MADLKLSALTALAAADVVLADDILEIVDTSATTNKKITGEELRVALRPVLGTPAATTSGTAHDFTGIPAGTRKIKINFAGVSVSGTSSLLIQLGDSGGIETTGYLSASSTILDAAATAAVSSTAGFIVRMASAAVVVHGSITLSLLDSSAFTWAASGVLSRSDTTSVVQCAGSKSLSAELTQIRLTTVNGTDTFDAGSVNILYE